ncbi:MAG TPA: MurT ligase domain-containing protein, partial [Candidatus Saccharimonadaceae bacterium]|nr:MurT ligase domain-containing protein [Candidatus Saccharimonadaceae bacterium]
MANHYKLLLAKAVRSLAVLRGGGSALPGLFIEKIDPHFVETTLADLPYGVVVVSGTNGKTTTTKIVVEMLESQGLSVFTNRTGSNFVRGVAAALLGAVDSHDQLKADIAVLELDEAHATHFVRRIKPRYSLLLNVMRDQLDRFGEIDATARLLHTIAAATSEVVVLNRDDPRLEAAKFTDDLHAKIRTYGAAQTLQSQFVSDDNLHTTAGTTSPRKRHNEDTELTEIDGATATISWSRVSHSVPLKLSGIYNVLNATAAIALTRAIMGNDLDEAIMLEALTNVTPAFGRGETIVVDGKPCELVLVKNPAGFRLSLSSFDPSGVATMITINDNYADGRDMSWLWDVDFRSLKPHGVAM